MASRHYSVKVFSSQYIDGGGRLVMVDTGEVMDKKERKDLGIETMKDEFIAVETMKSIKDVG